MQRVQQVVQAVGRLYYIIVHRPSPELQVTSKAEMRLASSNLSCAAKTTTYTCLRLQARPLWKLSLGFSETLQRWMPTQSRS